MKYIKSISTIIIAAALAAGCSSPAANDAETHRSRTKAQPVKVMELKKTTIAQSIDFTASALPFEEVNMSPSTPGESIKYMSKWATG
jgi:PBP1b-binding outer membrane lipoprotein LpoB